MATEPSPEAQQKRRDDAALWRWQGRVLPYMLGGLISMAFFFLAASLWVFMDFRGRMEESRTSLAGAFDGYESEQKTRGGQDADYLRWKVAALLEEDMIARRYRQANSIVLARIWTRYLGFLTGMILSLVGSFFVLGQLRTDASTLEGSGEGVKVALGTSSPGLFLATLGSIVMVVALTVSFEIDTRDVAIYMRSPVEVARDRPPRPFPTESATPPGKETPGKTPADDLIQSAPRPPGQAPQ
jgi:hypothetical protein